MFQSVKNVVFWLVVVLSAILLWKVVRANDYGKETEVTFSQFMQDVDQGSVSNVTLSGSEVHGRYNQGNAAFRTVAPANYSDMIRDLRAKGVSIAVRDTTSSGTNALLNLSPLLVFAALWFVMIRQIKGRTTRLWSPSTNPPPLSAVSQGAQSWKQSARLLLADSAGAMAFGFCRSEHGNITFYPESQIGPVAAWMLAPTPPADVLLAGK